MTDLEIIKLCAEAMKYKPFLTSDGLDIIYRKDGKEIWYHPIEDDAQAMALLRRFPGTVLVALLANAEQSLGGNVLRTICECVAQMQLAKKKEAV